MQEDDQDADADAQRQLEGLRVLYGACCNFFLGTQAAEEAAAAAATAADTAGAGAGAVGFPANSLPLAAAMMLDRFALLLHPDQPSIITPQMLARKAMLLHQGCESPSLRREIKEELLGRRMLAREQQAALEEYGETFEISRRPHIYDIPFPPRASQLFPQFRGQQQDQDQDQEVAAAAHTADNDDGCTPSLPFSQSHVYTASKAFYERNHERAWISAVPFGVTTNAKLADAYARVLLAYLQDLAEEGDAGSGGDSSPAEEDGDGPRTAHIVELAAGHGLFGFLLAKRLRELSSASSAPSPWRIRLVMTDFNRRLLESRRAAPWLRPFGTDGSVDFAVLDASCQEQEEGQGLELLSGRVLRPGSLRGPLIVLGNYALDSLPSDIFFQLPRGRRRSSNGSKPDSDEEEQEEEDEDGGESVVRELVADPTTRRFHLAAPCPARLASYRHAGLLRAMLSRGREGLHVVNAGFLAALAWLRGLLHPSNRHVAVLAGDGAFQYDDDNWLESPEGLPRAPLPDMSPAPGSGCFAIAVDAQALALAVRWAFRQHEEDGQDKEEGWLAIRNTEVESSITVSLVARRPRGGSLARTREAFWRRLCLENPSDIEHLGGLLQQEVEEDAAGPSFSHPGRRSLLGCLGLGGIMGLLAWSQYDADLWFSLLWVLRAHVGRLRAASGQEKGGEGDDDDDESRGRLRAAAIHTSLRCLGNRLALGAKAWHYTRLVGMRFFYSLDEPGAALAFFLHDAQLGPCSSMPPLQWRPAYGAAFGRAAEAFLVVRCLEALDGTEGEGGGRYDFPSAVRREIMQGALDNPELRDGKGRRRIERTLEKEYSG